MRIATTADAATLLVPFFANAAEERVIAMHLGAAQALLGITLERVGGAEDVELPVGAILATAVRLGATGLIVAHNHPSGDPMPSDLDKAATRRLAEAARVVGLRLVDHLIFAGSETQSLAALGLL